jgi:CRISPR type I-E-associated protein CasB/Cse2
MEQANSKEESPKTVLYKYMCQQIERLSADTNEARADSALWRHSAGRTPGEIPELFGKFISSFPEGLKSSSGWMNGAMNAAWLALTLFVLSGKKHSKDISLGKAAGNSENIHKRLLAVEETEDISDLGVPLRAVVKLISSGKSNNCLDFAMLATDLMYWPLDRLRIVREWEADASLASSSAAKAK